MVNKKHKSKFHRAMEGVFGRSKGDIAFNIVNYLVFLLIAFTMVYPFYYVLEKSFVGYKFQSGVLKKFLTFDGYKVVFSKVELIRSFFFTVLVVVMNIVGHLTVTMLAAYALSKDKLRGRKYIMILVMITMQFGGGLIPYYILIRNVLQLHNTIWVYVLPDLANGYNTIIALNFVRGLPDGLEEAALIDGANFFQVFYKIIIPLSFPIMATIGMWIGVGKWNAWFETTLFVTDPDLILFQNFLQTILSNTSGGSGGTGSDLASLTENAKMAVIVVGILPVIIAYPFFQKHFTKGAFLGSVKG